MSPRPIDPRGPRFNQAVLTTALLVGFALDLRAVVPVFAVVLFLGAAFGARFGPFLRLYAEVIKPRLASAEVRRGPPTPSVRRHRRRRLPLGGHGCLRRRRFRAGLGPRPDRGCARRTRRDHGPVRGLRDVAVRRPSPRHRRARLGRGRLMARLVVVAALLALFAAGKVAPRPPVGGHRRPVRCRAPAPAPSAPRPRPHVDRLRHRVLRHVWAGRRPAPASASRRHRPQGVGRGRSVPRRRVLGSHRTHAARGRRSWCGRPLRGRRRARTALRGFPRDGLSRKRAPHGAVGP